MVDDGRNPIRRLIDVNDAASGTRRRHRSPDLPQGRCDRWRAAAAAIGAAAQDAAPKAETKPGEKPRERGARQETSAAKSADRVPGDITIPRPGSDFMVDVIKTLDIDYVAANPASAFRSLHESLVNYGGNRKPELITCMHEETSVGIAHGYAKAAGKPMMAMVHGTVGLQHASMGIYNAWCDRVPVILVAGNGVDASKRRAGTEWYHSVQDAAAIVRDFVKWDDTPASLQHFAESMVRAYRVATTAPMEPVLITADIDLQEEAIHEENLRIPKLTRRIQAAGDYAALEEAAKLMAGARNPVIIADRAVRTPVGGRSHRAARGGARRAGGQPGRAHELPESPPAVSYREAPGAGARRRCRSVARGRRPLGAVQPDQRPAQGGAFRRPQGCEDDQPRHERCVHPQQLPGLPALHADRPCDRRRSRRPACRCSSATSPRR